MITALLVTLTQQMRIKFVNVTALFAANVAFPRISVRMAAFVEEIQRLIGESYTAIDAL